MTTIDSAIDTSLLLSNKTAARKVGDNLGKDDFLKLLITQLQHQDPSSPMDNTQFIAQMATFSTLEQMVNIGSKIDTLIGNNKQSGLLNYSSFVGKEVTWHSLDGTSKDTTVNQGTGVIESIQYKDDKVTFILDDGTKLEPGNISEVKNSATANSLVSGSGLIGKIVTWKDDADQEVSAKVKSVLMSNGKIQYEVDDVNGTKLSNDQLLKIATA